MAAWEFRIYEANRLPDGRINLIYGFGAQPLPETAGAGSLYNSLNDELVPLIVGLPAQLGQNPEAVLIPLILGGVYRITSDLDNNLGMLVGRHIVLDFDTPSVALG